YSYDETEGDFAMEHFSVENDRKTLIPFIRNVLQYNPDLKIWASPWSPPSWMKYNKHYASRSSVNNDLPADREGREGTDMFIQEDAYLKAYALYFQKFIEAYRKEGIAIFMVMPQNEFNSAQTFPSCCWTAKGLARFIGNYLGPAMKEIGVEIYFGTMERPAEALVDTVLQDDLSGKYIKGIGFQWAGKNALPGLHKKYPGMVLYQTEQECGDGKNDWAGAMHSWELMKHYLNNGVSVYEYWNTSLLEGGVSRWGWAQNSLVVVDADTRSYRYTPEYYVMKHASHYVLPGAKRIETAGTYDDLLAFRNPDNSMVLIIANQEDEPRSMHLKIGDIRLSPELKPHSLNTIKVST
ncbi:MAG: glycoside hydrolase family 30 protein, partial [Bacteroidales bacterium]